MTGHPHVLDSSATPVATRWVGALTVVRVLLAITFVTYGVVKVLGGQYNYGDWVIDKKTVDGTSLVWAFYGYSPLYGRFTGLFELVPAVMLLVPRTATIGAGALFAVALNITAMDFAFHYPAVKYFSLAYTILLGILIWADRRKWALLLLDRSRVEALRIPAAVTKAPSPALSPAARRVLLAAAGLFVFIALNVVVLSLDNDPQDATRRALVTRIGPNERIELLRSRQSGLVGVDWVAAVDFAVIGPHSVDTMTVRARRVTALRPWRVTEISRRDGSR